MNPLNSYYNYLNPARYIPDNLQVPVQMRQIGLPQPPFISQNPPTVASYRYDQQNQPTLMQAYRFISDPNRSVVNGMINHVSNAWLHFTGKK